MQLQELSMITVKTPDRGSERITIVDVDVHIHERPKEIAPYCDMPWRRSLEMMAEKRPIEKQKLPTACAM
jgi:hypothetical protein